MENRSSSKLLSIALIAYVAIAVIAAVQGLSAGPKVYIPGGRPYIDYNNFRIFKFSFYHLIRGKDIYQLFPDDHWDLYKYSPGFALCFGMLSWMPDPVGLLLWNLVNSLCLFAGIRLLPGLEDRKKAWILLFCLLEMLLSIQNTQSNGLMAGLTILGLALAERRNYMLSTLCIVFSFYIKIYGALAFIFYLWYPGKWKLAGWSVCWMLLFGALPLLVVNGHQLLFLYQSWLHLLVNDRSASIGLSVMGLLEKWFNLGSAKNFVTVGAMILFLLPLLRWQLYSNLTYRLLYLSSTLIWMVIFNHKAESPTYIIAMAGIGIWYFSRERDRLDNVLLILSFLLISMSVSDLVPAGIRNGFIRPYGIKAVMAIVVWGKIVYEQLTMSTKFAVA
ncbi:MAG TPA: glycosyltransferase family 87 protein [Puia sp.]|nr:glycosyltransferase family 87 protein [Puia sp.]